MPSRLSPLSPSPSPPLFLSSLLLLLLLLLAFGSYITLAVPFDGDELSSQQDDAF